MISDSAISKALIQTSGNVSAAARAIGISRRQLIRRIELSDALGELVDDLRNALVDDAETCIADSIRSGDVSAAKWLLLSSKMGRSRGYSKNLDMNAPDDEPLIQTVEVVVETPEQVQRILRYEEYEIMVDRATEMRKLEHADENREK